MPFFSFISRTGCNVHGAMEPRAEREVGKIPWIEECINRQIEDCIHNRVGWVEGCIDNRVAWVVGCRLCKQLGSMG